MFNKDKAFDISDDGLLLENGTHFISGTDVPIHSVNGPTVYFRSNNEVYFNDGISSGWTLQGSSSGYQKYTVGSSETYSIPEGYSSVITGPLEIEGIVNLDGRLEVI